MLESNIENALKLSIEGLGLGVNVSITPDIMRLNNHIAVGDEECLIGFVGNKYADFIDESRHLKARRMIFKIIYLRYGLEGNTYSILKQLRELLYYYNYLDDDGGHYNLSLKEETRFASSQSVAMEGFVFTLESSQIFGV